MAYALIARKMGVWTYKAGVGMALVAGFALGWSARRKAPALARTLFTMAAMLALIAVLLLSGAPPGLARNMAIGHGTFVTLFTASGLLFRHASLAEWK